MSWYSNLCKIFARNLFPNVSNPSGRPLPPDFWRKFYRHKKKKL